MPTATNTPDVTPPILPPLEPGNHLTRAEFERRYEAMPHIKKAELIEGIVYIQSRVCLKKHGQPHAEFNWWLAYYTAFTPGVCGASNTTVRLDHDNEPQPDCLLIVDPQHGGQVVISADDIIEGAADLVAEVATSTTNIDLHTKLQVYRRNQVQEYIVWRVQDKAIDWFALRQGEYVRLPLNSEGVYQSDVFPGLWLDAAALTRSDLPKVLQVLQRGLATPGHADFVARLGQGAASH